MRPWPSRGKSKGGRGDVYRARDKNLARDVANKVLPAALAQDPISSRISYGQSLSPRTRGTIVNQCIVAVRKTDERNGCAAHGNVHELLQWPIGNVISHYRQVQRSCAEARRTRASGLRVDRCHRVLFASSRGVLQCRHASLDIQIQRFLRDTKDGPRRRVCGWLSP
jgi:hypothetical protein